MKNILNQVSEKSFIEKMDKLIAAAGGYTPGSAGISYTVEFTEDFNVIVGGYAPHANLSCLELYDNNFTQLVNVTSNSVAGKTFENVHLMVYQQGLYWANLLGNCSITFILNDEEEDTTVYPFSGTDAAWHRSLISNGFTGQSTYSNYLRTEFLAPTTVVKLTISEINFAAQCVAGNSLITCANGEFKRIDEIAEGDLVAAINPATMALEYVPVTQIGYGPAAESYEVFTFSNGTKIKAVGNHRFYHKETNAMEYIQNFTLGDHSVDADGNFIELVSKEIETGNVTGYFLHNIYHNYFVDGLMSGDRATKKMSFKEV